MFQLYASVACLVIDPEPDARRCDWTSWPEVFDHTFRTDHVEVSRPYSLTDFAGYVAQPKRIDPSTCLSGSLPVPSLLDVLWCSARALPNIPLDPFRFRAPELLRVGELRSTWYSLNVVSYQRPSLRSIAVLRGQFRIASREYLFSTP